MKKLFFIIGLVLTYISYAQTAEQIIIKHLEVTGGLNNWKELNSTIISGEIIFDINETYPIEIYQQRPNLNKTTMRIQDKKIILNGYNGKKAIQYNFQTNKIEENNNYIPEPFDSDLVDYSTKGFHADFIGTEKINNSDCYKVKLITNIDTYTYYFDKSTYQLIKEENKAEIKTYSNFKTYSGLIFPCRIEIKNTNGESNFVLIFKTIEVNKPIAEKEFKF